MSFQIYFRDERQGQERTSVCVADSLEEFRNTTVEELKRKLIPEDQLEDTILRCRFKTLQENRTLGFYGIKHEDHIIAVRRRIPVKVKHPRHTSLVHLSLVKDTKPDNYGLEGSSHRIYGFYQGGRCPSHFKSRIHPPKDEDEDEDKVIPRSQSMDNLLLMHQPQLEPSE